MFKDLEEHLSTIKLQSNLTPPVQKYIFSIKPADKTIRQSKLIKQMTEGSITQCYNCQVDKTPMWRRTLDTETNKIVPLCNACGLYYKSKGTHRPNLLIAKKNLITTSQLLDKIITARQSSNSSEDLSAPQVFSNQQLEIKLADVKIITCSNCSNINTSIWRKDSSGKTICNACGLYFRKNGVHRHVSKTQVVKKDDVFFEIDQGNMLRVNVIKRRKRSIGSTSGSSQNKTKASFTSSDTQKSNNVIASSPSLQSLNNLFTYQSDSFTSQTLSNSTTNLNGLLTSSLEHNEMTPQINPRSIPIRRSSTDITQYHYTANPCPSPSPSPPSSSSTTRTLSIPTDHQQLQQNNHNLTSSTFNYHLTMPRENQFSTRANASSSTSLDSLLHYNNNINNNNSQLRFNNTQRETQRQTSNTERLLHEEIDTQRKTPPVTLPSISFLLNI